ncbi:MAG: hypothetical protein KGL39_01015 [Patescibacteria group bacterium]|nr:hypothetical protein [Patescibacteria group bacterium]
MATVKSTFVNLNASSLSLPSAVTVPNGGTGVTSFTPNAVVCGGTTPTGNLQSRAASSVGQALYSNGASLPSFSTLGTSSASLSSSVTNITSTASPGVVVGIGPGSGGGTSGISFTPVISGKVLVTSGATVSNTNSGTTAVVSAYYATGAFTPGSSPTAATGHQQIGATGGAVYLPLATTNYAAGGSCALLTLSVGTLYYFDLAAWTSTGTLSVISSQSAISIVELPA